MTDIETRPPKIQILRSGEAVSLVLPVKTQGFRRLLCTIWLAVSLGSEGALVAGLAGWKAMPALPREGVGILVALFSAASAFMACRFLWYHWGREVFTVDRDALRVRRGIAGMGRSAVFPLLALRRVKAATFRTQPVYPSWGRFFIGRGDSQVLLNAGEGPVAYGRGLGEAEAADLAALLNDEVQRRMERTPKSETRAARA